MQGGFGAGISGLAVFIFQWVPATILSLSATGASSGASAINPITSAVTLPEMGQYLQSVAPPQSYEGFVVGWGLFSAMSLFVSLLLATTLIYCVVRLYQVREFERRRFEAVAQTIAAHDVPKTQLRWERIVAEVNSDNEQQWRLAILEADIMLSELLDTLGYRGETLADKMRSADRADFNTIDFAWEAHRARNRIAHEGSAMQLDAHEARRIMELYHRVFREFQFVA